MKTYNSKSLIVLFCCIVLGEQFIKAQEFAHDFGKCSSEELRMVKYDKDPSAEAVVIYDIGQSFFTTSERGFDVIFERKTKIKIFSKAGLKWANIEIPYYVENSQMEDIYKLHGNTYNYENGVVRTSSLNTKNTYEEKINEHWMVKKFALPDVKEGSVIEIEYKIETPYLFNFRGWEFQSKIPVMYSEYKTKMVPFYDYTYILQGASKLDDFKSYVDPGLANHFRSVNYQFMVYEFTMKDVPAFKDEGYITSINDYIIKLDFQLSEVHSPEGSSTKIMTTWPIMIKDLLKEESFGKYLRASQKSAKTISDTMKLTLRSDKDEADIIERYVKNNFNWNGQKSKFASKSLKDFLKTKTGNSAEINLYLTGLLNSVGIEAYPAIISTRDNGKVKSDYPFLHFFNYVIAIAKIDGKYVLLDATEPMCHFGEVPTRCLNDMGLIVNKEKTEWVNFSSTNFRTSITSFDIEAKLNTLADSVIGSFNVEATGYEALALRKAYLRKSDNLKNELLINKLELVDSIKEENLELIEKPFKASFKVKEVMDKVENKILISPFFGAVISDNPFKQSVRTYPIDMIYKKGKRFTTTFHIPSGYKVVAKPENYTDKNNLIEIQYFIEQIDVNTIKVVGYYEFKKEVYDSSEYTYIKGRFNKIIDKFNDKIVLVKID